MNHLAIFLNNTDSEIKYNINLHNYNILKNNFENIIIEDIYNDYSIKLKNDIFNTDSEKIIKCSINNEILKNNAEDLNLYKLKFIFKNIIDMPEFPFNNYKYITFISDNYIYLNSLKEYFDYINLHNLDFYSFSDSTERRYHHQNYLFSIKSDYIKEFIAEINKRHKTFRVENIFSNKISFLKVAYIKDNIEKNIFFNDELYIKLLSNNLLPIVNISRLIHMKLEYYNNKYTSIPNIFKEYIYRSNEDLKDFPIEELHKHFIYFGQYEFRKFSDEEFILPIEIRTKLNRINLLNYFDVPYGFDIYKYRDLNEDLKNLSKKDIMLHWINYGVYENREYK